MVTPLTNNRPKSLQQQYDDLLAVYIEAESRYDPSSLGGVAYFDYNNALGDLMVFLQENLDNIILIEPDNISFTPDSSVDFDPDIDG